MCYSISNFYCTNCSNCIPLPRMENKKREKGHLKKLYCPCCKQEVNHLEVREIDYYMNLEELLNEAKNKVQCEN